MVGSHGGPQGSQARNCQTPQSAGGEYGASLGSTILQSQWQLGSRNSMKSWDSLGNSIRNINFGYRSSTSGISRENVVVVDCSLGMGLEQRQGGKVQQKERPGKTKRDNEVPNNVTTVVTSLCWTKGINQLPFLTTSQELGFLP